MKLRMEVGENAGVSVVYAKGRIVYREEATALSANVLDVLSRVSQVVIDLSGVEIVDSAGLGELIAVLNFANARGCSVKLASPNQHVHTLLKLFKLTTLFEVYPTLNEAVISHPAVLAAQC